ncbi:MAG: hypothetical protein RLZZ24_1043 [Pseudomonadota bacterium]
MNLVSPQLPCVAVKFPFAKRALACALSLMVGLSTPAWAKRAGEIEGLSGELFYQILLGELNLREGSPNLGLSLLLDAARKTNDAELFSRSLDVALQVRSGEGALAAASAWSRAYPQDRKANNQLLQILIVLGKVNDTLEPLRKEITLAPEADRAQIISLIPRQYARVSDKNAAANTVAQALEPFLNQRDTAAVAWATLGRMRLLQNDKPAALQALERGFKADGKSLHAALLALELMSQQVEAAEPMLQQALARQTTPDLAMAYVRLLIEQQRYEPAQSTLEGITKQYPQFGDAWLVLGSMQFEQGQESQAELSLARYVALAQKQPSANTSKGLLQAQSRRAELLARHGKLTEGRALIANLPSSNQEEQRNKLLTEVQLLRDHQQWQAAYDLLGTLKNADNDLLYEQAMLAEKLNKLDDMERLFRLIIERDPGYYNAYNALGFALADRNMRLAEAKQLIVKALALAPDDPYITDSLGWVEFRLGNLAAALMHLQKAYDIKADAEIGAHLGEVLWQLKRTDDARRIWQESLKLAPDNDTLKETLKRLQPKL